MNTHFPSPGYCLSQTYKQILDRGIYSWLYLTKEKIIASKPDYKFTKIHIIELPLNLKASSDDK